MAGPRGRDRPTDRPIGRGHTNDRQIATALLIRGGDLDQARAFHAQHPYTLETEDWFSLLAWGHAAAVALWLDAVGLADEVDPRLQPYAGRNRSAGSGNASGTVDAFLALTARARGDRVTAAAHADRAEKLMREWQIPLAADWLHDLRARFTFGPTPPAPPPLLMWWRVLREPR